MTDTELDSIIKSRQTRKEQEKTQTVTIRLSHKSIQKVKTFGRGYTGVMSEILEKVLTDNTLLKLVLEKE